MSPHPNGGVGVRKVLAAHTNMPLNWQKRRFYQSYPKILKMLTKIWRLVRGFKVCTDKVWCKISPFNRPLKNSYFSIRGKNVKVLQMAFWSFQYLVHRIPRQTVNESAQLVWRFFSYRVKIGQFTCTLISRCALFLPYITASKETVNPI